MSNGRNTVSGNAAVLAMQQQRAVAELTAGIVTVLAIRAGGTIAVTTEELNAAAGVAVNIETEPDDKGGATIIVTATMPTPEDRPSPLVSASAPTLVS